MLQVGRNGAQDFGERAREPQRHIAVTLTVIAVLATLWFLAWAKDLLIPLALAVFLSICLAPAVNLLSRLHVPRPLGAAVVLLTLSTLIGLTGSHLRDDADTLLDELPAATRYLQREVNAALNNPGSVAHRIKALMDMPRLTDPSPASSRVSAAATAALASAAVATAASNAATSASMTAGTKQLVSLTGELAAILFLVYLMLASAGQMHRRILGSRYLQSDLRLAMHQVFSEVEHQLRRYLGILIVTNAAFGLAVWGCFRLFDVSHAGVWGIAAGALHFVPYVGPAVVAVGSGLLAAVQFHSVARALVVGGTVIALSGAIGVALQTWLSGRTARMNTVAVFVSLLLWTWLWGLPGLLLGTPIMMAIKVVAGKWSRLMWLESLLQEYPREHAVARRRILRSIPRG
jgi:predicted PurR-regulated permease PerM